MNVTDELVARIEEFCHGAADDKWKLAEFSRANAIQILSLIHDTLLPELQIKVPVTDDLVVNMGHPATDILLELINALRDLDDGKQHKVLKARKAQNASNPRWQDRQDKALAEAVRILARKENLSIEKAEKKVAANLARKKWLRRGKNVRPNTLRRLRKLATFKD